MWLKIVAKRSGTVSGHWVTKNGGQNGCSKLKVDVKLS